MKTAAIIIPSFNESGSIEKLIQEIFSIADTLPKWILHIWIVDSHSSDQTDLIVKRLMDKYKNLHLLETKKEGLGKAYIAGFRAALDSINPYVLFEMDGDGSHLPKYIPQFLEKIEKGADFVIGSRYMKGGSIPSDWGLHRKIFSVCANIFVKFGFMKLKISDWTSGYRAIKSWIIRAELSYVNRYSGYVFQVALLDKAVTKGANIDQIPIQFIDRIAGRSKINAAQYFVDKVAECIVSHRSHLNPKTIEARILWDADKLDRLIISRHADLLFAEAAGKDISIIYYQALGDLRNLRVRLHFEQSRKFHDLLFKQLECFLRDNKLEPYLLTRNLLLPGIIAPCDLGDANKWLGQANHALDMDNFCA